MGDRLNSDDEYARTHFISGRYLFLDDQSMDWILDHIDCFDRQARLNESVKTVRLHRYSGDGQDDEVWDKVGQAIGHLQAPGKLHIYTTGDLYHEEVPTPGFFWCWVVMI